jgi:hypothetical protein
MSAGTSTEESAFLAASSHGPGGGEGEDVFFMTAAKLSPADLDNSMDIYDAHICSAAAPCPPPPGPVPPACTTAESCRAASPPQPAIFGAPPSQTFAGAGNVVPPITTKVSKAPLKCTKAKRRSHGRCVKAKPKAKRRKRSKQARRARRPRLARGGRRTGRAV